MTQALVERAAFVAVIALLLLWVAAKSCARPDPPLIPAHTQQTLDSLRITAPGFRARQDSVLRTVIHDTIIETQFVTRAATALGAATTSGRAADSLAILAQRSDSLSLGWRRAYTARTVEADSLRVATRVLDSALMAARDARTGALLLYAADTVRRVAVERVNADLVESLRTAKQPCKFIRLLPCPTRTVTFVIGTALGAGAATALLRR
jgi:hypothetical protein